MNDEIKLRIEGLMTGSLDLNNASGQLSDICTQMYSVITSLRESETFKTVVASNEYFGNIDELNAIVPKYEEAILKFSQFLSNYVLQNFTVTDEETKSKIESNLAESISQLSALGIGGESSSGGGSGDGVDYSKISSTASGALAGDFIDSSKIRKSEFEDGELEFVTRPDGSVQIVKNGSILGYTTKDGIGAASTQTAPTATDNTSALASGVAATGTLGATAAASAGATAGTTSTEPITDTSAIDPGFSGDVYASSQISSSSNTQNNQQNTENVPTPHGNIKPGTHYSAKSYSLSEQEKNQLKALVAGEDSYSYEGALAVASTILNRCESPQWSWSGGGDVMAQATWKDQFAAWNGSITKSCLADSSNIPSFVDQAVEDCLNGTRNHEFTSFRSNKNAAPDRVQIGENGNYYF